MHRFNKLSEEYSTLLATNNQSGRSMIEMLGVLAIIGVLSVGGISGYSKAMAKYKLTKAQDQITMLLMNIRTAYATSPSYSGLDSATAADYNLAPNEMVTGTGSSRTLNGTFGGAVTVEACKSSGICGSTTSNTYFGIKMEKLGKEACRSLASSDWGADGLVSITVSGTTSHTHSTGSATSGLPIGLGDSASYCNSETNDITWVYY